MRKKIIYVLFMATIMFVSATSLKADNTPIFGGKLSRGIKNLKYYYPQPISTNNYETVISRAANDWKNGNNPINTFSKSYDNFTTDIDFYHKTSSFFAGGNDILALAQVYGTKDVNATIGNSYTISQMENSNWYFAKIFINNDTMPTLSTNKQQGVIAHEIGHAFGLKHNQTTTNSIMFQGVYDKNVYTVQEVDNAPIRQLYK